MKITSGNLLILILLGVGLTALLVVFLGGEDVQKTVSEGYFNIRDVDVEPLRVTTAEVDLNITAYIDHWGGTSRDVKMITRAISTSTGLLEAEKTAALPTVEGRRTVKASQHLTLKRQGGYTIKLLLLSDGAIVEDGSFTINGLEGLEPASHKTDIQIEEIDFTVRNVTGRKITAQTNLYLTNLGSTTSEDLKLLVKAREVNSNIIGDRTWTTTGNIPPEATVIRNVSLTIPAENNYIVDVLLWKNQTLTGRWQKTLYLAPTRIIPEEAREEKIKLNVSEFTRKGGTPPYQEARAIPKTPGFQATTAAVILVMLTALLKRRWRK